MTALAPALLNPRRIALVGASADPTRLTARRRDLSGEPARRDHSRRTRLSLDRRDPGPGRPGLSAARDRACGRCHRRCRGQGHVDLAYLLLATEHVEGVIADVAAKGIPVAAILADGFAEAGPEGVARQERLLATARGAGVRILGPNSMGMVNVNARSACSVNAALEAESLPAGRLALVSQSGSMLGAIMARGAARGLGFSHLISTGNEADLTASEIAGLRSCCSSKPSAAPTCWRRPRAAPMPPASRSSPSSSGARPSARSWRTATPARWRAATPPPMPSSARTASRA